MKYHRISFIDLETQEETIQSALEGRLRIHGNIPITGRSMTNYSIQLFPDISSSKLLSNVGSKDYLDVACGINHLYRESLLSKLAGTHKKHGLDIHDLEDSQGSCKYYQGSAYKTKFSDNSYDLITVNNFMYLWELDPEKLLALYKEFHRILRSGGELRVFPVFYGNYYRNNVELHEYLNTHFAIRCLRPVRDYSKEPPVYLEDDVIKKGVAGHGTNEHSKYTTLMAHVAIFTCL